MKFKILDFKMLLNSYFYVCRSPQEFISVRYLQDKLNHAVDLNNLPKLGKKDIEKSYSRIERNLTKLSTFPVQQKMM